MKELTPQLPITAWLPTTREEMGRLGWDEADVIIVSGDAYVDHPSFGHAVIGRVLEKLGLRVAILPQPNWRDDLRDFKKLGRPRLFFGISAGCMDSMINHYTAAKRRRSDDAYTPGGQAGFRPDYASTVYTSILKQLFPGVPVLLGGIEASLRRFTHYDYWSDSLMKPILCDSGADMLVYGMGEKPLHEIVRLLRKGVPFNNMLNVPQTAFLHADRASYKTEKGWTDVELAPYDVALHDKRAHARNFRIIEEESNRWASSRLLQQIGDSLLVVNPPYLPMTTSEIDASFDLPYTRMPHPRYKKRGEIPAWNMIRNSVNIHRGCFGGCAFCTISAHQGKFVSSRSEKSILKEIDAVTKVPGFDGVITDLGGPSANMYQMSGIEMELCKKCRRPSCIFPAICANLNANHGPLLSLYDKSEHIPGVKKIFIGSGIRYDLLLAQKPDRQRKNKVNAYIERVVSRHVSGRLKVAPEHTSDNVLKLMRKPSFRLFVEFKHKADSIARKYGLHQQVIPYFISSHPGCELIDMANLAIETKKLGYRLEQVQDFTPTPLTLATEMYYTGLNPYTLNPVYTAVNSDDKLAQRRFFFWYQEENHDFIRKALLRFKDGYLEQNLFGKKSSITDPVPGFRKNRNRTGK
ncbi:MAG TPA: YgiQ family radical SAM protein [Bacteroidales bacterium]|nr:MAG: YgiQ family radical SAM protein [Bacteroidetes bacterium GWE2_42_24]OFY25150.1 MAG: YgiQ family radical SAM protein [Bacteroidetes bacterium GWF2_43_11]HBZ66273.1 YgiQ family radical SAM protein [Bacteroidales bacterium]